MTRRARRVSLRALCAALLALAACREHAKDAQAQAPPVAAATVAARDLEERIGASGELEAQLHTTLAAEVAGRITRIVLEEGAPVVAGTIVVEIDPERRALELDEAKAHAAQADARLAKEKRETDRVRTLYESKVASQSKLDGADTALEVAQADSAAARAQQGVARRALSDASVSAPFAGLLARRHVNVGEFVQPGAPLFDLVSLDPIDVVFHLAEVDSSRVAIGQEVEVHVAPYPDRVFDARVAMVSPTIDPGTRTLRVKATLPNPEGLLRPGLFARADLGVAQRKGVTLIPSEAVLQRANGPIVFVVGPGDRVQKRDVRLGAFYRDGVEVQEGVTAGEVVVTRGHSGLVDGAVVRVAETDGHAPPPAGSPPGVASAAEPAGPSL
ncbi:MAG TPA: efflux RND transporter periplasmic adaptor subunit [Myxococcota bacterium]|nr:efflux RND transporter periplasmic adaptor subunit [Myxococcota bacterium]